MDLNLKKIFMAHKKKVTAKDLDMVNKEKYNKGSGKPINTGGQSGSMAKGKGESTGSRGTGR
jgi:hypothetical protein